MTHPIAASKEVKVARKRIKEIGVEISDLNAQKQRIQADITRRNNQIRKLKDRLKELEGVELTATDHAILRYLERVQGLDLDEIRKEMITDSLKKQVEVLGGTGKFPGPNNTRFIMDNKRIVSVVPA